MPRYELNKKVPWIPLKEPKEVAPQQWRVNIIQRIDALRNLSAVPERNQIDSCIAFIRATCIDNQAPERHTIVYLQAVSLVVADRMIDGLDSSHITPPRREAYREAVMNELLGSYTPALRRVAEDEMRLIRQEIYGQIGLNDETN